MEIFPYRFCYLFHFRSNRNREGGERGTDPLLQRRNRETQMHLEPMQVELPVGHRPEELLSPWASCKTILDISTTPAVAPLNLRTAP